MNNKCLEGYDGFETGPIRPPSEASSLMVRVTRNCPWNQCTFCRLYKGTKFSIRKKEHVIQDIDLVKRCIDGLIEAQKANGYERELIIKDIEDSLKDNEKWAYYSAINWFNSGMRSIFLQDANSMIIKPNDMVDILNHIKASFPEVERITSYARSHTIARISDEDLKRFAEAGLNRIHIGMETAADVILKLVKKGVDKKTHIVAGQKVKKAGIELSEYFMPGLGGNEYSYENAIETADALNQINPDFIRIRTLAITDGSELAKDYEKGIFTRANDVKMVEELLLLIENLDGITSTIKSDHILNLLPEVDGVLPMDKEEIISCLKWFLELPEDEKIIFRIGRRTGMMNLMSDLDNPIIREQIISIIEQNGIDENNIDEIVDELIKRFI